MPEPPFVYELKPWPRGCPKCHRRCMVRKSRYGYWFCAVCGHRQEEEPRTEAPTTASGANANAGAMGRR